MRQTQLPFSPKKTRLGGRKHKPLRIEEDESDSEPRIQRRSGRNRGAGVRYDEDYQEDELDESDGSRIVATSHKKAKKKIKKRGPKPAYGTIRDVEDLDNSDDESAPLRAHRDFCEKCKEPPSHILMVQAKRKRGRKKAKRDEDEDEESDGERASKLGGWVRCLKCCIAAHWRCLAKTQQDEILKAARAKDAEMNTETKRMTLEADESTEFVCGSCSKGGTCLGCEAVVLKPEIKKTDDSAVHESARNLAEPQGSGEASVREATADDDHQETEATEATDELLFRCVKCKRVAHYAHLVNDDEDMSLPEIALHFQNETGWQCGDCASFTFHVDKILAWRPYPAGAPNTHVGEEPPNYKLNLPREYLVKWDGRSYRRVQWVPHMWLASTAPAMLKNFLTNGTKVELLPEPHSDAVADDKDDKDKPTDEAELPAFASKEDSRESSSTPAGQTLSRQPPPLIEAERHIPPRWKTVDRILDIRIWSPRRARQPKKSTKGKRAAHLPDESDEASSEAEDELRRVFSNGDEPSSDYIETIAEFESRTDREVTAEDIGRVVWAFIKWDDLTYDESSWDSPPEPGSIGYAAFIDAFNRFLSSRKVVVPKLSKAEEERRERRNGVKKWSSSAFGIPEGGVYDIEQSKDLKLMDFQVNGVNWLCRNWFMKQQCILADEMGLGKTVQIVTFLGLLHARMGVFPSLVVVPNSTITNWVREFARWAPQLRVVPLYGEQNARAIIKKYELFHEHVAHGTTGAKFHVLVTTYDTAIAPKEITAVFKRITRWEVLVVDEGQRLKGDSSLLFKRLTEMHTHHRVLMTGTPLNNNIRELFNLMHFLDPVKWNDLDDLTQRFEELDDERVKDLHEMLRPYFLRRVKADVLKLPPKNEVIVPVSMAPIQKEVYKSLLSKNLTVLQSLTSSNSSRVANTIKKSNLNNLLMQLRKCLQHPYIISENIEPKGLSTTEAHTKLIDACGKLRLLKLLLPRLKARGHRVLLFSQFKLALDIIEDFVAGEGFKFLRLDGDVKQQQRQKDMDEFNRENSDVFIFLLTTRAGGVGINLWSADTVIIFDPDFNPHQDLQAIARAHRFGQTKTCLVFKLMSKGSCEEKIFQAGKKKLVLDHLIVQKMDAEEDADDIQSMLTFGASDLFNEDPNDESKSITYTEQDIDNLIEKTEKEGDNVAEESSNNAMAFAKIWSLHKDGVEDLEDDTKEQDDAWAQTLAKMADEQKRAEKEEKTGRGTRRKAALAKSNYFEDASPEKKASNNKRKSMSVDSEDEYQDVTKGLPVDSDNDSTTTGDTAGFVNDLNTLQVNGMDLDIPLAEKQVKKAKKKHPFREPRPLSPIHNTGPRECGLCHSTHGPGGCLMTQTSENLVEYRMMLVTHADDEPWDDRVAAVNAIDRALLSRNEIHLVAGQPSKPIRKQGEPKVKIKEFKPKAKAPLKVQGNGSEMKIGQSVFHSMMGKRPSPSTGLDQVPRKKLKLSPCPLCKADYHGTLEECAFVRAGPRS
ncbi:hypothetical protein SCHPADRAFT_816295 [Schizopora paradoxa]|uniref:Chromatin remodeling factor mit1 n=1 Tax=Schizopora paradoxa TaxID=27342 RepID=A0A0H2S919_9AGAM|nr:hypothetical protein SCHPADRAFT_816295 [Schizopora paradoxa]